jgi:HK97 family phage portal protein
VIARARDLMRRFMASAGGLWTLKDPRYWGETLGGGRKTVSSEYVGEESALKWSAVWCATQLYCGIGSSLPLPIFRGLDDERRKKVRQHPLYSLLNVSPNPEMTAAAYRSILWQWQVNWGNAYSEIEREGNTRDAPLVHLWPLHPERVRIKRDDQQTLYYEVRDEVNHTWTEVDAWRIWHIPSILTTDGIEGRGVVQNARETIGAGIASEKKAAHVFGKGNLPRVVIEQEGPPLKDEHRKTVRSEWHELYDDPDGENVALLGGGAKAHVLSFSNQDSQFIESRGFGIEDVARWYNVAPHMLKRLVNSTYNNIELMGTEFVRYSLLAWLKQWEQSIAKDLMTDRERKRYFAEHNVDALLRGDAQSRSAFYHSAINDGWMSRNEVRKLENLDPAEGGDVFLVQGAMVPLGDDGTPIQPDPPENPAVNLPQGRNDSADDAEAARAEAAELRRNVLRRDLDRMLVKETKAVLQMAKTGGNFVGKVDEFYAKHVQTVQEVCEVLMNGQTPVFATRWCGAGKSAVLDAAGNAARDELPAAVAGLVESKLWTDRPERTIGEMAA